MKSIDLNCDMGEGMQNDALLMPYISSANIACGYHAGDEDTMKRMVELALKFGVSIGAHPGFADKINFGRKEMKLADEQYYSLVAEQLGILKKITDSFSTTIHHVKPHGALYNMAAVNRSVAATIAKAIKDFDANLFLYGLSGSHLISEAKTVHLKTASEVFADRTSQDNGTLTPRSEPNALIRDEKISLNQVLQMVRQQSVTAVNDISIRIIAETICIHGDGEHAVTFAKNIYQTLKQNGIAIKTI